MAHTEELLVRHSRWSCGARSIGHVCRWSSPARTRYSRRARLKKQDNLARKSYIGSYARLEHNDCYLEASALKT